MKLIFSSLLALVLLSAPGSVTLANGQGQVTDFKVLEGGGDGQCPSVEERERARNEIRQIVASVVTSALPTMTALTTVPSTTTSALTTPTTVSTLTDCNGTPGWRRVAFINMTDTSYNCPTGLNLTSYSKRTCGRSHTNRGCSSTTFSVGGLPYSRVCGRIRGYQRGVTAAFFHYTESIDSYYVEGVSLTHGGAGRRRHIWTFAAGRSEVTTRYRTRACPCDTAPPGRIPSFVGNDYFCESGLHSEWDNRYFDVLFPDDVLWDGQNCTSASTCCQFNNPPWFTKNLPTATTDDIELRICDVDSPDVEDVPLELIELYVQ